MNYINIEGVISRISNKYKDKNITFFEIARNNEYMKDGFIKKDTSFFSAVIDTDLLCKYKNILKVGQRVVVSGIPNSYFDKEGRKCFAIRVLNICLASEYQKDKESYSGPKFGFDDDGVMLWNGKRCESIPMNPDEEKEIKDILSQYEI